MPEVNSVVTEYPELLFFDTFSHGSIKELNLDLVQFTNRVYVSEIRIIPLGARVQADFPGGVRLGATNPSEFSVEFFVNDLSIKDASTFQNLGVLEYNQNGPIELNCKNKQILTDGLILRGWYTTITLALYGFIETGPPQSNLVPQNPLPSSETPPPRVISEHKTAEWVQQHAHVYYKEEIPYDIKDLSYEKENSEWPQEKIIKDNVHWEKDEPDKEILQSNEKSGTLLKAKKIEEKCSKTSHRRSSFENDSSDNQDYAKQEDKKIKTDCPYSVKSKLWNDLTQKLNQHDGIEPLDHDSELEYELKQSSITNNKREKSPDMNHSPKQINKEVPVTLGSSSLAPEDVELISEDEISETEDVGSPSISGMQVMDEVNDLPNETLTPSAHEDSLDMDQFEPILSGSSDVESEEEIDFQDIEFDPSDLVDDPNKIFNTFLFEVQPLLILKNPGMTDYEWELLQLKILEQPVELIEKSKKIRNLVSNIESKLFEDNTDDWVINVENLIPILETGLIVSDDRADIISRLMNFVNIGLDFDKAYNQSKPVFKVRHLKAGLQLAETLSHCGENINLELLKCTDLQRKLLNLYEKEYLALSVKLMILKSIDFSTNYGSGVKQFMTIKHEENGYRRLIKIFRNTHSARVRYSLTNLLRKIHLYETLENLQSLTNSTANNNKTGNNLTKDADVIVMYLEDTLRYIREAPILIGQPIRFLPICPRFEYSGDVINPYFSLYSYLHHFNFLDLLLAIMTNVEYAAHSSIISCVSEILSILLNNENGLIYLATKPNTINKISKILSNSDDHYSISPQLGLTLAHRLYVLNLVDNFQYKWQIEQMVDIDNTHLLEILSSLYHLTFTTLGKQSVTHVLSRGNLIKPFLKALQFSRSSGRERRKSPGKAYITDLIWMIIKCSDYVPFLERHRVDLIDIASWQADSGNSSWLNPIRNEICFTYHDITDLCDYLKKHTEKSVTYPGELITTLRILRYLAISSSSRNSEDEKEVVELKYKFVLIQLFSQEGLTYLTSILNKVSNHYERPHLHTHTFASKEGIAMMTLILPTVQLIRALLEYVVRCRDVEFKDLTAIPALLKIYCLMYSITPTSAIHLEAIETNKEIVETFLTYTQTVAIEPLSDSRSLNKSLWSCMISEILKFSFSTPEVFVPSLYLLSELLPLPLPMQTKYPLSDAEISLAINSRKLWCAHLLPLDNILQELISTLFWSSYQPLLQLLKRACVQLADLGPPTSLVVARSILSGLWTEISSGERYLSSKCSRLLNIFACLLTHPPIKMAVIQVTNASNKTDEIYSDFWRVLFGYLSSQPQDNNFNHIQGQECIISIIQSLCDIEISLYPPPNQNISLEVYLSNSLPPKNIFRSLCETLVKHADNKDNGFSTISLAIRACVTLTEYDYGMNRLKICLSEHSNMLWNVINKITSEWNKDNPDCVNCLSNTLEFLKECLPRDTNVTEPDVNLRTLSINSAELGKFLKWNLKYSESEKHPLEKIDAFLLESLSEEDLFPSLRSNVTTLIETLNAAHLTNTSENIHDDIILSSPEPLLTQFQFRSVFIVGEVEDERLSVAYWLSILSLEDIEQDVEQVICNLEEIISSYIPNLQMENELEKFGHHETTQQEQTTKNVNLNESTKELESKPIPTVLAIKLVKPQNYIRQISGPYRNDAFRSRIPNSSRAPSLHVDDFIALEKHNQQTAALGYNRLAIKHQTQESAGNMRNRNHSFLQDRGNHFHSPFRPTRGIVSTWHPLIAAKQVGRNAVKTQPSVIRHPSAAPLMMRGADLMRFSLALRWPTPQLRPPPPQLRHHAPPHTSMHRHHRPTTFPSL